MAVASLRGFASSPAPVLRRPFFGANRRLRALDLPAGKPRGAPFTSGGQPFGEVVGGERDGLG